MKVLFASMRLVLMLCFALMQGMAPIAHAHVNGQQYEGHPHLDFEGMHVHPVQSAGAEAGFIEHDHSAVVTLPPEHRCKETKYLPQISACGQTMQPPVQAVLQIAFVDHVADIPSYTSLLPPSQAPPVNTPL